MAAPLHVRKRASRSVIMADREERIIPYLLSGASLRRTADAVGVDKNTVQRDIRRILQRWAEESEEDRAALAGMINQRYERLLLSFWPDSMTGNVEAAGVVLKVLKGLREMFGLDSPTRIDARIQEVENGGGTLIERMKARAAMDAENRIINGDLAGSPGERAERYQNGFHPEKPAHTIDGEAAEI
jgi:DNA-binding CsgD family transcriptional regulator